MNASIKLSLDMRQQKKDDTYPIVLRLTHFRKTTAISTGYFIPEKYWIQSSMQIRNSYKGVTSVTRLNNVLHKKLTDARSVIISLDEKEELDNLSLTQLRARIDNSANAVSLTNYTEALIASLKEMQRFGTARAYQTMLSAMQKQISREDISFHEINLAFLKSFETAFIKRGNSYNGLSAILRSLRAVLNKAVVDGKFEAAKSPFLQYKIKETPTAKRAIVGESVQKIIGQMIEENHPCFDARNIFLLSYSLWGMNVIDLAFLKVLNVVDGRLRFERRKTHRPFDIKISPLVASILGYYCKGKEKDAFILPIIKREAAIDQDKDVQWYRKRYNKKLRDLAELCGIQEHLTSYVARHSFASNAENIEIPIQAISKMLGHSRVSTTEIYLKGFSKNSIDSYHEKLLSSLE